MLRSHYSLISKQLQMSSHSLNRLQQINLESSNEGQLGPRSPGVISGSIFHNIPYLLPLHPPVVRLVDCFILFCYSLSSSSGQVRSSGAKQGSPGGHLRVNLSQNYSLPITLHPPCIPSQCVQLIASFSFLLILILFILFLFVIWILIPILDKKNSREKKKRMSGFSELCSLVPTCLSFTMHNSTVLMHGETKGLYNFFFKNKDLLIIIESQAKSNGHTQRRNSASK